MIARNMKRTLFSIVLASAFVLSCSSKDKEKQGDVIAKVNGHPIYASALESRLQGYAPMMGGEGDAKALAEKQRQTALDSLINEEVAFQAALKEKIAEKSERLRHELAREYLRMKMEKKNEPPSDSEIENYFNEKKANLERIRVSHILVKDEAKARKALAELKAKGDKANFGEIAKKYSEDPRSKDRGGDLFFFTREKVDPDFAKAAFDLKNIGELSPIVKTAEGYEIIKLTGEQRGFEFFKPTLKWEVAQKRQQEERDELFKNLRKSASIKLYEDAVAKVGQGVPETKAE